MDSYQVLCSCRNCGEYFQISVKKKTPVVEILKDSTLRLGYNEDAPLVECLKCGCTEVSKDVSLAAEISKKQIREKLDPKRSEEPENSKKGSSYWREDWDSDEY